MITNQEGAARRNRALRKIRGCRGVPIETRAVLEAIIDCLGRPSSYSVAWPTARTIGRTIGRSARTVRWHLRAIRAAKIFEVRYLSPEAAIRFCRSTFGFEPKLDRVQRQAPPLYCVHESHWLWGASTRVTPEQSRELAETIALTLGLRNRHRKLVRRMALLRGDREPPPPAARAPHDLAWYRQHLERSRVDQDTVKLCDEDLEGPSSDRAFDEEVLDHDSIAPLVDRDIDDADDRESYVAADCDFGWDETFLCPEGG